FSSRRRHTRSDRDWSSDVCSSDLLGDCEIHERIPAVELARRAADAEILLTNKVALPRDLIVRLPKLRYIGVTATGYNIVDVVARSEERRVGKECRSRWWAED